MKAERIEQAKELLAELKREDAERLAQAKARLQAEVYDSPEVIRAVAEQLQGDLETLS